MVLAERTSENLRNGRRSRGPSPNGHASESTSGDEADGVPEEKIRVGRDYQAVIPEKIGILGRSTKEYRLNGDRALLVWSPTKKITDASLDEYIKLAKEKYGYNGEQALGMLFWHKHDLERAIRDLANFTPFPDEWTVEDKVLFEQAFQFHGKSFHRIRQMLPDKSISHLVKYYYSWKKTRTRTSLMDRQARKLANHRDEGSEGGSEHGSNTDSDSEDKVKPSNEKAKAALRNVDISSDKLDPKVEAESIVNYIEKGTNAVKNGSVLASNAVVSVPYSRPGPLCKKRPHSPIRSSIGTNDTAISPNNKRRLLTQRPIILSNIQKPRPIKLNRGSFKDTDGKIKSSGQESNMSTTEIDLTLDDSPVTPLVS